MHKCFRVNKVMLTKNGNLQWSKAIWIGVVKLLVILTAIKLVNYVKHIVDGFLEIFAEEPSMLMYRLG